MYLELSILTLNIWGIPFISKDKDIRVKNLAQFLTKSDYDVISLQEVWSDNDYEYLRSVLKTNFPFYHYFHSGVVGSGLCCFSKWPIVSVFYHSWAVNGYVHRIQHGDWFGGKGVGFAQINFKGNLINIYLAHLHAEYNKNSDEYLTHRIVQAFDTAQFIRNTRGNSILQVLAGDLNTQPHDIAYRLLTSISNLQDTYNLKGLEGTHEVQDNTYTDQQLGSQNSKGIRIDYILFRARSDFECEVFDYNIGLPPGKIPDLNISYSDHEAVSSTLILKKASSPDVSSLISSQSKSILDEEELNRRGINNLRESIEICNKSLKLLESHRRSYSIMAIGVILILFNLVEVHAPYGLKWPYLILKFLLCTLVIFFVFMASVWNIMEKHGILSGKLSMEIEMNRLTLDVEK